MSNFIPDWLKPFLLVDIIKLPSELMRHKERSERNARNDEHQKELRSERRQIEKEAMENIWRW